TAARNAFVPLATLQKELTRARENQPKLYLQRPINALLVEGGGEALQRNLPNHLNEDDWGLVLRGPEQRARTFFKNLGPNRAGEGRASKWPRLRDKQFARQLGLKKGVLDQATLVAYYRTHHNYLALESRQLFIESPVAEAARLAARKAGLKDARTLVYLADRI